MKRIICIILALVMIMGMTACSKRDIEKYRKIEGMLLEIEEIPCGPMTEEEYEMRHHLVKVSYAGDSYIPSPIEDQVMKMKDEDYRKILDFCLDNIEKNKFADYSEQADDGVMYKFTAYDEDGASHLIYDGYIYQNKELIDIVSTVTSYSLDNAA
ncbi:MAG: hypothetical protein J5778_06705 [Clostridiales bacterium]|nr:hypothetical protein [Clostridiales bacterium]